MQPMVALAERNVSPDPTERAEATNQLRAAIRHTLRQAVDLQQLAYEVAMEVKRATCPKALALAQARAKAAYDATKSWEISVDRVRIVRNKPLPGSLRQDAKPTKRKSQPTMFSETKPE